MIYGVWRDIYNVKIPAPSIGADFELCDGDDPEMLTCALYSMNHLQYPPNTRSEDNAFITDSLVDHAKVHATATKHQITSLQDKVAQILELALEDLDAESKLDIGDTSRAIPIVYSSLPAIERHLHNAVEIFIVNASGDVFVYKPATRGAIERVGRLAFDLILGKYRRRLDNTIRRNLPRNGYSCAACQDDIHAYKCLRCEIVLLSCLGCTKLGRNSSFADFVRPVYGRCTLRGRWVVMGTQKPAQ